VATTLRFLAAGVLTAGAMLSIAPVALAERPA